MSKMLPPDCPIRPSRTAALSWVLFKSEWRYYRGSFFFALSFGCIPVAANLILGWADGVHDIRGTRMLMLTSTVFYTFVYAGNFLKEKRRRLHTLLPVSARTVSLIRILLPLALWFGLLVLFLLAGLRLRPWSGKYFIMETLTVNGFFLMTVCFAWLIYDLRRVFVHPWFALGSHLILMFGLAAVLFLIQMMVGTNSLIYRWLPILRPAGDIVLRQAALPLAAVLSNTAGVLCASALTGISERVKSYTQ